MSLSALNISALEASGAKDCYFLWLDFTGSPLRACTGTRTYTWGAFNWLGIGEIGGIADVAHAADVAARPFNVTLSGTDSYIVQVAASRTNYKGRQAVLYRGMLDASEALVDTPFAVWSGRMDVANAAWSEGEAVVQFQCEPLAARLLRPNISRYSDQDHQLRYPGDKFFEFLPQMESKDVMWGGMRVGSASPGGRPRPGLRVR